jgi:hypothetical protein
MNARSESPRLARVLVLLLGLLFLGICIGCGGDDTAGPSPASVVGTWQASKVEYVRQSPPMSVDLIGLGGSAELVLDADHSFIYTMTEAGQSPDVTTGTWQLGGEVMTVSPDGLSFSWQFEASLSGGTLKLTGADSEFDFDGDDVPDAAKMNLEFHR